MTDKEIIEKLEKEYDDAETEEELRAAIRNIISTKNIAYRLLPDWFGRSYPMFYARLGDYYFHTFLLDAEVFEIVDDEIKKERK